VIAAALEVAEETRRCAQVNGYPHHLKSLVEHMMHLTLTLKGPLIPIIVYAFCSCTIRSNIKKCSGGINKKDMDQKNMFIKKQEIKSNLWKMMIASETRMKTMMSLQEEKSNLWKMMIASETRMKTMMSLQEEKSNLWKMMIASTETRRKKMNI